MTIAGPVFLRWREGVSPAPAIEEFDSLDAALDAIEERWEKLQHQAPQIAVVCWWSTPKTCAG
jgi:hypothetical protein